MLFDHNFFKFFEYDLRNLKNYRVPITTPGLFSISFTVFIFWYRFCSQNFFNFVFLVKTDFKRQNAAVFYFCIRGNLPIKIESVSTAVKSKRRLKTANVFMQTADNIVCDIRREFETAQSAAQGISSVSTSKHAVLYSIA